MEGNSIKKRKIYHWEKVSVLLVIFDIITICVSYGAALWLRFDLHYSQIPADFYPIYPGIYGYHGNHIFFFAFIQEYMAVRQFYGTEQNPRGYALMLRGAGGGNGVVF